MAEEFVSLEGVLVVVVVCVVVCDVVGCCA
jgi:hypothetical protein